MNAAPFPTRTLWPNPDGHSVSVIDQTALPHVFRVVRLTTLEEAAHAIRSMQVRGAPLIGVTAAYGLALALRQSGGDILENASALLEATRPTAVNLHWALVRMRARLLPLPADRRADVAWKEAGRIAEEDVEQCCRIGEYSLALLEPIASKNSGRLEIMTHCNAGWLAALDHGTAIAPVYAASRAGIDVHVWVSETRPRNQGLLTAWELRQRGVPNTFIADNAAGLLLLRGQVDAVIVGADRVTANGDVANKVGTCLKALAAREAGVPFFVAAPRSTFDFSRAAGADIPIEERSGDELRLLRGIGAKGAGKMAGRVVRQLPSEQAVFNPAFDITPARLVTAFITERGVCAANAESLLSLYPEERNA